MTLPKFNMNIVKWFDWLKYLFLIYITIIIWLIWNVWQVPTELNGLLFLPPCPLCNVIKDNSFCCWQTNALERLSQVTVGHTIRTSCTWMWHIKSKPSPSSGPSLSFVQSVWRGLASQRNEWLMVKYFAVEEPKPSSGCLWK